MWNECVVGNFNLVTNALAREYQRSEVLEQCQGVDQSGDDMLDDDEDDEEDVDCSNNYDMNDTEEEQVISTSNTENAIIAGAIGVLGQQHVAEEGQTGEWEQVRRSGRIKNKGAMPK